MAIEAITVDGIFGKATDYSMHPIVATSTYMANTGATITGTLRLPDDEDIIRRIMDRLNFVPTFEHKCNNCGGILELRTDEHLFRCPYCNSCYAIGTNMKNDKSK